MQKRTLLVKTRFHWIEPFSFFSQYAEEPAFEIFIHNPALKSPCIRFRLQGAATHDEKNLQHAQTKNKRVVTLI
jgi:hypothetical protein